MTLTILQRTSITILYYILTPFHLARPLQHEGTVSLQRASWCSPVAVPRRSPLSVPGRLMTPPLTTHGKYSSRGLVAGRSRSGVLSDEKDNTTTPPPPPQRGHGLHPPFLEPACSALHHHHRHHHRRPPHASRGSPGQPRSGYRFPTSHLSNFLRSPSCSTILQYLLTFFSLSSDLFLFKFLLRAPVNPRSSPSTTTLGEASAHSTQHFSPIHHDHSGRSGFESSLFYLSIVFSVTRHFRGVTVGLRGTTGRLGSRE